MRILVIPSFFKNNENPSSGSFFTDQAVVIKEKGHDVSILFSDTYSLKHISDYLKYKEINEEIDGVPVYRKKAFAPLKRNGIHGSRKSFEKCCLSIIKDKYNGDCPFDVIHAHNCVWAGAAAQAISRKYHIPYVVTEHSSMYALGNKKLLDEFRPKLSSILSEASEVACVSNQLRQLLQSYTEKKIRVIGNIVDTDSYRIEYKRNENQDFVFVSVAFLTTEERVYLKGMDLLVDGFRSFCKTGNNAKLKIIGVDKNLSIVKRFMSDPEIKNNVIFEEPLNKEKISKAFASSNCFILLGKYETFGLVYAEAMAAGLPVIATDVGITSEIIDKPTGIIIKERTVQSVCDAMLNLYHHYCQYDSNTIRKKIIDRYSKQQVANEIEKMYFDAVKQENQS